MDLKKSKTLLNLTKAFAGETQAGARYQLLAQKAQQAKLCNLAKVLKDIATNEMAHAKVFYNLITDNCKNSFNNLEVCGGYPFKCGSVADELKYSADNEKDEFEKIYPEFAKIAKEEGFDDVSTKFNMIAQVENCHNMLLGELYAKLSKNKLYKSSTKQKYKCSKCGFEANLLEGWQICPLCGEVQGEIIINLSQN